MKRLFIILIFLIPVLANAQRIRINQMRSTGEPAGRLIVTDGSGSFEFGDNNYAEDSTTIADHINNDLDTDPTNELPDSIVLDTSYLYFYYPGQTDSVSLADILKNGLDSIGIGENGNLYFYSDSTIIDSVPLYDGLTAEQITVIDTAGYFSDTTVEGVLKEIWEAIEGGGDGWGSDTVVHDNTLIGPGITGDPLKVDTSQIATKYDIDTTNQRITNIENNLEGDGWGADTVVHDNTIRGPGTLGDPLGVDTTIIATKHDIDTLAAGFTDTDNQTLSIDSTASRKFTISIDGGNSVSWTDSVGTSGSGLTSVEYDNLESDLIGNTTNNTVTWNIDGSGIITCSLSSSGTVAFSNPKTNKYICVVLTLSSGATLTWPASAKILDGSATLADGTFYVYIHCISGSLYTVSITKEAS